MTNAVSAIANGGRLMRPHVVKARVYDGEVLETEPTVIHTVLSKKSADELAGMMVTAVEKGNPNARVKGFEVAGKSGTAQIAENGAYLPDQVNASFVGFAPAEDAKVVVFVRLERPDEAITLWASQNSAIIFSNVMRRVLEYLNVPPNDALEAWAGATPQEP
jgi:cell division protein FtsI/penicillin-binding protein 2